MSLKGKDRTEDERKKLEEMKMGNINQNIADLTEYGIRKGLIEEEDRVYTINRFLELFGEDEYTEPERKAEEIDLPAVLAEMTEYALQKGILCSDDVTNRDLFDTRVMGILTPRPSEVNRIFAAHYRNSPEEATEYFYTFSGDVNYIRRDRVRKDLRWKVNSVYGEIDITINLSKPEKDPKAIAAARKAKQCAYPKCQLCIENEGYAGRMNHPARQNHRIIPLILDGQKWGFQYSPYVYYQEHCIVLNTRHVPMKIDRGTFSRLLDFIRQFPHYFLGSNADLPIVGGSILTHDHFQGGRYDFAMAKAPIEEELTFPGFEDVEAGIVHWPLSVIRIRSTDPEKLIDLADRILQAWRTYTDEQAFIYAMTDGEPHNTITPIARRRGEAYELDLALRNNITTETFPLGVYHPHQELHHIKKENIGLIEVMGLAVLPSRLKNEMTLLQKCLLGYDEIAAHEELEKHRAWAEEILRTHPEINDENAEEILKEEIGKVFVRVLEDAGVYKCTPEGREAFRRFVRTVGC